MTNDGDGAVAPVGRDPGPARDAVRPALAATALSVRRQDPRLVRDAPSGRARWRGRCRARAAKYTRSHASGPDGRGLPGPEATGPARCARSARVARGRACGTRPAAGGRRAWPGPSRPVRSVAAPSRRRSRPTPPRPRRRPPTMATDAPFAPATGHGRLRHHPVASRRRGASATAADETAAATSATPKMRIAVSMPTVTQRAPKQDRRDEPGDAGRRAEQAERRCRAARRGDTALTERHEHAVGGRVVHAERRRSSGDRHDHPAEPAAAARSRRPSSSA